MSTPRYKVTVWHGEGRSIFYVIDTVDDDVIASFMNRENADRFCADRNA